MPVWMKEKLFPKAPLRQELEKVAGEDSDPGIAFKDLEKALALFRASPEPCGERLLPVTISRTRLF